MEKIIIDKNELGNYIVQDEHSIEVRFFLVGVIIDGKFTGMMHDYCGGGVYEEALVVNDIFIPTLIKNETPTEWDDEVTMFESCTTLSIHDLNTAIEEYMTFDTEVLNYVTNDNFKKKADNRVLVEGLPLAIPYGLGNTSFIDGYELEGCNSVGEDDIDTFSIELLKKCVQGNEHV